MVVAPKLIHHLENNQATKKSPTATEIQHFKASRRAALARVASQKKKELARKKQAERDAQEERRKREAEVAARTDELRSVAMARAESVAAQKRHREREVEMFRRAEVRAKRERVAAVLAYDETKADEHEKRMRKETSYRIQREKRRRQLALQQQEDERMERMRLYERGGRYDVAPVAPPAAVQTARSFFSVSGSVVRVKVWEKGNHCGYCMTRDGCLSFGLISSAQNWFLHVFYEPVGKHSLSAHNRRLCPHKDCLFRLPTIVTV